MSAREAASCRFRRPSPLDSAATCGLLQEVTHLEAEALCAVNRDACEACCQWFEPSADHLNPVVASLLYGLTARIIRQNGAPGCSLNEAEQLNLLAERILPTESEFQDRSLQLPDSGAKAAGSPIEDRIPLPRRRGSGIRRWAVGITTAWRESPTLERCCHSLINAGWESVHLFVDGKLDLPASLGALPRTVHEPAVGVWLNYLLSLIELRQSQPDADAFLIAQDDALLWNQPSLRAHVDRAIWQGTGPEMASLFCPTAYTNPRPGWHVFDRQWTLGPVAFVFSREAVDRFLRDRAILHFQQKILAGEKKGIDGIIGEWAFRSGIPIHYTTPSLVQHIGHTSTLWPNAPAFGNRRASSFEGEP